MKEQCPWDNVYCLAQNITATELLTWLIAIPFAVTSLAAFVVIMAALINNARLR